MKVIAIELHNIEEESCECIGVALNQYQAINKVLDLFNDDIIIVDKASMIIENNIESNISGWISFFDKEDNYYKAIMKPFDIELS